MGSHRAHPVFIRQVPQNIPTPCCMNESQHLAFNALMRARRLRWFSRRHSEHLLLLDSVPVTLLSCPFSQMTCRWQASDFAL